MKAHERPEVRAYMAREYPTTALGRARKALRAPLKPYDPRGWCPTCDGSCWNGTDPCGGCDAHGTLSAYEEMARRREAARRWVVPFPAPHDIIGDVNPACGHHLGALCTGCGCCATCDGCYCLEP